MNKDKQLHNDKINLSQLVLLGLGSLIGSGWLFGAWEASSIAGPVAIISWVLGFLVIGTIAYNYIEIGTMFPQSGGMSNYAQYTHGSLLGFIAAWANWVSLVTIIPIEAVSAVQYMSSWPWHWAKPMRYLMENGSISTYGLLAVYLIIVIFSFNSFQTIINMGSEIKNPEKNIARGIAISLSISAVLYIILQSTFITSMPQSMLQHSGWNGINFNSPFADLAILLGINWLAILLYIEAFVSPFGTGVSFVAVTGRVLRAMEKNGHIPKFLGKMNEKYHIPRVAIIFNAIISMIMVTLFRDWGTLAAVISTATLVAYLTGPTTVIALRKMGPTMTRPFRAKILKVMAPLSFVLASLAIYWAMWPTTAEVILIIILGLPIYFFYEYRMNWRNTKKQIGGSLWIIVYLIVLSILSFIGSKEFKGLNMIHYPFDFIVIIVVALIFYYIGTTSSFESVYFRRATRINTKMRESLNNESKSSH
ncbi:TPA: APC family permease [Staphylococcus aureus]|uniref:APC family permease n=1 Tax=Staphylococcus aureus TaxID=1280 RepID=UPI000CD16CCA|nr:APC family permease [Staphylococcus aureus]HDA0892047.1 APC family permease [Staphylococcus aureus]HDA1157732.1 APC family permease [Staphylococcus aureus]HDA1559304.1 APC family permease [Staphylococcus aureus]HDA3065911.1 APC family permease [Staphylococcus aureus]HDA4231758.1 APC family permease [Staphylococcus aureus]